MILKIEALQSHALQYAVNKVLGFAPPVHDVAALAKDVNTFVKLADEAAMVFGIHFVKHFVRGAGVAFVYNPPCGISPSVFDFTSPQVGCNRTVAVARVALELRVGREIEVPDCFDQDGNYIYPESV